MTSIPSKSIRRGVERLRVLSQPLKNKLAGIAPRSSNDYATHIPILVGIAQRFTIRRVLELGCGIFSTPTFLNREVFPDLLQLNSYETDQSWFDRIATEFPAEARHRAHFIAGSMSSSIHETELGDFDLIFVDDSTTAVERAETIRQVSIWRSLNQLIVIHDFEISDYREAASIFEYRQVFRAFTPQTGVVWNGANYPVEILKRLNRQIIQHSRSISVDDVNGWRRVLREDK